MSRLATYPRGGVEIVADHRSVPPSYIFPVVFWFRCLLGCKQFTCARAFSVLLKSHSLRALTCPLGHLALRSLFRAGGTVVCEKHCNTFVGVELMFVRTLELLSEADMSRLPPAPMPRKWLDEDGKMMGWVFGAVGRPEFEIDESEVPY